MGQIRKRGGVYWIRYYRDGERLEESARTAKWEDARDLLKSREGDVADGRPVSPKAGRLRFEDAAADMLTDYLINKKRSYNNLKNTIIEGALEPWFRGRRMRDITTVDVRAYVKDRLDKGYANATINRELSALKRMFKLAKQAKRFVGDVPHIPMLKETNVRTGFFERAQFEAVRNRLPPMYQALETLAYYTGWRVAAELLPLEWRQFDLKAGIIRLEPGTTKNDHGRTFKYAEIDELVAAIEGLWARHEALERQGIITPLVFCRRRGQRIKSLWKRWRTACKAAGCPGRNQHDFRRTAVRNLNRASVTETVAMKITGHKTRSVFDRYDITSEEDLAEASRKLQTLAGTIAGTNAKTDAEALKERLANSVKEKRLKVARGGIEPSTLRFSVRRSKKR
jgi:integrase